MFCSTETQNLRKKMIPHFKFEKKKPLFKLIKFPFDFFNRFLFFNENKSFFFNKNSFRVNYSNFGDSSDKNFKEKITNP